jgi:hypothetical protein
VNADAKMTNALRRKHYLHAPRDRDHLDRRIVISRIGAS